MPVNNSVHLVGCGCMACTGQSSVYHGNQQSVYGSAVESSLASNKSATALTSQNLPVSSSTEGYVKGLIGNDAYLWGSGGYGTSSFGAAVTVRYTFQDVAWGNPYGYAAETAFSATQTSAAMATMQLWSSVANINFVAGTAANAQLAFRDYDLPPGVAGSTAVWAYGDGTIARAEVAIDIAQGNYDPSGYGFLTIMHEVGHALGLKHPGNYNAGGGGASGPFLSDYGLTDSRDFTVMSYYGGAYTSNTLNGNPITPMLYDIAAIQKLYGVNHNYRSGNDTYAINSNSGVFARWDGAGNDTLNSSAYTGNVTLDLREGAAYVTHVGNSHSWNAFGANIENATAGTGNDALYGNALNNVLIGGVGNDTLGGGAGNDTLQGGAGNDLYLFNGSGDGTDTITDADGSNSLMIDNITLSGTATSVGSGLYSLVTGGVTFDLSLSGSMLSVLRHLGSSTVLVSNYSSGMFGITLGAPVANAAIYGTALANVLNGTSGADVVYGLGGNDTIGGGSGGADRLWGGDGNDSVTATGTGSYLYGEAGNDILTANGANSSVEGGAGNDYIILNALAFASTVSGGAGDDILVSYITSGNGAVLRGDDGNDLLYVYGGSSAHTLEGGAGDDLIYGGNGNDAVYGGAGNDTIYGLSGNDMISDGAGRDVIYGGAGADTIQLTADANADFIRFDTLSDGGAAGVNAGFDVITGFVSGSDRVQFGPALKSAWDDIGALSNNLVFAVDRAVNFNTAHEAWMITGLADNVLDAVSWTGLLGAMNSRGVTASAGSDGLIVAESAGRSEIFSYRESSGNNNISASELTLLATINSRLVVTDFDFYA